MYWRHLSTPTSESSGVSNGPPGDAYLLVFHGSQDPNYQIAVEELTAQVSDGLKSMWEKTRLEGVPTPPPLIDWAFLELHPLPLHQQIQQFSDRASRIGDYKLQVLPMFLLAGVHVMEDIPAEITLAKQALVSIWNQNPGPCETGLMNPFTEPLIDLRPFLGTNIAGLGRLLMSQIQRLERDYGSSVVWILLSHGSRRAGANQEVEKMANHLAERGVTLPILPAYWSVSPSLEERVAELVGSGYRCLGILPYFLVPGGIMEAIARTVEDLSQKFPQTNLLVAQPLGASAELAAIILQLTQD